MLPSTPFDISKLVLFRLIERYPTCKPTTQTRISGQTQFVISDRDVVTDMGVLIQSTY